MRARHACVPRGWLVNENIDKGATALITDQPGVLAEVLAERRGAQ